MTDAWKIFVLPESFKPAEDSNLQDFLRANATSAVRVDAGKLRRLDTTLIELLLCAAKAWRGAAVPFEVANLSHDNEAVIQSLGLTSDHLNRRAAA